MHGLLYYVSLVNFELSCQYKQLTHLRIITALRHSHLCICIFSSLHCIFSCWAVQSRASYTFSVSWTSLVVRQSLFLLLRAKYVTT